MTTYANPGPGVGAFAVTPHDTNAVTKTTRALYVGGAGSVKVTMQDNTEVTFVAVPAGTILPIRVKKVWTTGTTATSMLGIY